jgi:hypothetical protein
MPQKRLSARKTRPKTAPKSSVTDSSVFLNIPYDSRFENLYLAYIAAISAFGLVPRAAIEIPGGQRRLDRILDLIRSCRYSIHDLSRVQLSAVAPRTPRFNMPFELGLAVAWEKTPGSRHDWFVCEERPYRLQKSLSDLDGTDIYIHACKIMDLFGQLNNAFVRAKRQPTVDQMRTIYFKLRRSLPDLIRSSGAHSAFEARVFQDLCILASAVADITSE